MPEYPPGSWRLFCASEQALFAGYAAEVAAIGSPSDGTRGPSGELLPAVRYYQRDKSLSFDPLYQEPTASQVWRGPYRFPATVEFAESEGNLDQDVDDEGVEQVRRAKMVIAVSNWRAYVMEAIDPAFTAPSPGDIVALYDPPSYYSVDKVVRSGYVSISNTYLEWELELIAKRSFSPDRLLPLRLRN